MKKFVFIPMIIFSMLLLLDACKKTTEEDDTVDKELFQSAKDEALAYSLFKDADNQAEESQSTQDDKLYNGKKNATAIVDDSLSYPLVTITNWDNTLTDTTITIAIDYGTEGVLGKWGRVRKGKLIIDVSGRYRNKGSKRVINTQNFYIDDYQVEGTKTVTNMGKNADDKTYFSVSVTGGTITASDGKVITYASERTRTWVEGESTLLNIWDDSYEIEGSASGVNSNGVSYTKTIDSPLSISTDCKYIKEGVITLKVEGNPEVSLDYGDGDCDPSSTIIINGKEWPVTMGY